MTPREAAEEIASFIYRQRGDIYDREDDGVHEKVIAAFAKIIAGERVDRVYLDDEDDE